MVPAMAPIVRALRRKRAVASPLRRLNTTVVESPMTTLTAIARVRYVSHRRTGEIRFKGEPIAAVAAEDEKTALRALDQIKVEIDEEEPVFDPIEAMQPGAPKVRPEGNCFSFAGQPFRKVVLGDTEAGFQKSDLIVEGEYRTNPVEHTPLETQVSLAVPEADGKLTIHTVSQTLSFT